MYDKTTFQRRIEIIRKVKYLHILIQVTFYPSYKVAVKIQLKFITYEKKKKTIS